MRILFGFNEFIFTKIYGEAIRLPTRSLPGLWSVYYLDPSPEICPNLDSESRRKSIKKIMACKEVLINTVYFCQSVFFNCVDPDPYSEYGSGSTMLMNKDLQ